MWARTAPTSIAQEARLTSRDAELAECGTLNVTYVARDTHRTGSSLRVGCLVKTFTSDGTPHPYRADLPAHA